MSHILVEEEKPEKVDMTTPLKALTLDYDGRGGGGGGGAERKRERERGEVLLEVPIFLCAITF